MSYSNKSQYFSSFQNNNRSKETTSIYYYLDRQLPNINEQSSFNSVYDEIKSHNHSVYDELYKSSDIIKFKNYNDIDFQ